MYGIELHKGMQRFIGELLPRLVTSQHPAAHSFFSSWHLLRPARGTLAELLGSGVVMLTRLHIDRVLLPTDRVFGILRERNPELTGERRRTVLKPPQVAREGTKKTVFTNFMDLCKVRHGSKQLCQRAVVLCPNLLGVDTHPVRAGLLLDKQRSRSCGSCRHSRPATPSIYVRQQLLP